MVEMLICKDSMKEKMEKRGYMKSVNAVLSCDDWNRASKCIIAPFARSITSQMTHFVLLTTL